MLLSAARLGSPQARPSWGDALWDKFSSRCSATRSEFVAASLPEIRVARLPRPCEKAEIAGRADILRYSDSRRSPGGRGSCFGALRDFARVNFAGLAVAQRESPLQEDLTLPRTC